MTGEEARELLMKGNAAPAEKTPKKPEDPNKAAAATDLPAGGEAGTATEGEERTAGEAAKKAEPHPLAEFGVGADSDGDSVLLAEAQQQVRVLNTRIQSLEAELDAVRSMKANPLVSMSEAEMKKKVEELADDGKTVEAVSLMADWRDAQKLKDKPVGVSVEELNERTRAELYRYASQSPEKKAFLAMLADKKIASQLERFSGIIRADRPGAADLLHLACLGLKRDEIYKKGYEAGRASVGVSSPSDGSGKAANLKGVPVSTPGGQTARRNQTVAAKLLRGEL